MKRTDPADPIHFLELWGTALLYQPRTAFGSLNLQSYCNYVCAALRDMVTAGNKYGDITFASYLRFMQAYDAGQVTPQQRVGARAKCLSIIYHNRSFAFDEIMRVFAMTPIELLAYDFAAWGPFVAGNRLDLARRIVRIPPEQRLNFVGAMRYLLERHWPHRQLDPDFLST